MFTHNYLELVVFRLSSNLNLTNHVKQKADDAVTFEAQKEAKAQNASADADMCARQRATESNSIQN